MKMSLEIKTKPGLWKKVFLFSLGTFFGLKLARRDYDRKVEDVVELYQEEVVNSDMEA